ncbi:c-type cytochrome [Terasakiella sp. A23]|uniref:c-type cytochrome n=1 Tax=Terasakiella sp. FCG-A23 TaxID=3080561 RepID=UPI0029540823|nr:c-type cytochrome [Terasakiella sp. A23]MDV7341073.1 c-type cytochrome [Terasakiella sp. A23]
MTRLKFIFLFLITVCLSIPAFAIEDDEALERLENAQDINELCAGCHGMHGQGGGKGIYPRLAGLSADYMAKQIEDFKTRKRINLPMLPYANDRELSPEDVRDITEYLANIHLSNQLPKTDGEIDGLERLKQAEKVVQIGRYKGNVNHGSSLYMQYCRFCHQRDGLGTNRVPPLRGQHIPYLKKQLEDFRAQKREHDNWKNYLGTIEDEDIRDILAFLSIMDD